jgi:AsmA family protein
MEQPVTASSHAQLPKLKVAAALAAGLVVLLVLLVAFFPWDWLREPLNRYASERLGRKFEITRLLEVHPGWTTRVTLHGIHLANPGWAQKPYLIEAERADFSIKLWPLLRGQLNMPELVLQQPHIALQQEPDGRRTWSLNRNTSDKGAEPVIGTISVDKGELFYFDKARGADIGVDFSIDAASGADMPLRYSARGTWRNERFEAAGRTGAVMQVNQSGAHPFPVEVQANSGAISLKAKGSVASLSTLDGAVATFNLRGESLADLYKIAGIVLPETPPYTFQGELSQQADVWTVKRIRGMLGTSDLTGELAYDRSRPVALLSGKVHSETLDFNDLGPLVGLPTNARVKQDGKAVLPRVAGAPVTVIGAVPSASAASAASRPAQNVPDTVPARVAQRGDRVPDTRPAGKVLPNAKLDVKRLKAMDADVWYSAARIRHAQALPLERVNAHIRLEKSVLRLEPLEVGLAGGQVAGLIHIDGNSDPATVRTQLDAKQLQLNRLFPTVKMTEGAWGRLNGRIDLLGRGNSTATMLGTSAGSVALLMGRGEISNLLMEVLGLDGGEIVKFFVRGDRNVELRCAAAAFDVKQGLMTTRNIVLDTSDTVVQGQGQVSLADETLDILLQPAPKDGSILSLRSPLRIGGSFAKPAAGPDKAALAGRVGLAVALGAINPLLALAATIETGPGKDSDCQQTLALAGASATAGRAPVRP